MFRSSPAEKLFKAILKETRDQIYGDKLEIFQTPKELFQSSQEIQCLVLMETVEWLRTRSWGCRSWWAIEEIHRRLLQSKLPLTEEQLQTLLDKDQSVAGKFPSPASLQAVMRYASEHSVSDRLRSQLVKLEKKLSQSQHPDEKQRKVRSLVAELIGDEVEPLARFDSAEPWLAKIVSDLSVVPESERAIWHSVILHAVKSEASKPTKKFIKTAQTLLEGLPPTTITGALKTWLREFNSPRAVEPPEWPQSVWLVTEYNADLMKGLVWIASQFNSDSIVQALSSVGISAQKKIPEFGARSVKVFNAAVWALSQMDNPLAIGQLSILRTKAKNKSTQNTIDKAIRAVAERLNVSPDEVEEMALPAYGLTEVGLRRETFGEFTAELEITSASSTELRWIKADGKRQKTVPKSVKEHHAAALKTFKADQKEIQKLITATRDRIDLLHLRQKSWPYSVWLERYLNHPLTGTIARRLAWTFEQDGQQLNAAWLKDRLVDSLGEPVEVSSEATVSLWHPIANSTEETVAWRQFFEQNQIKQPFKQAHREVYLLTDAELRTETYSNRFASHIIKQHQFNALCRSRGWRYDLMGAWDCDSVPERELPEYKIRAEFWVEPAITEELSESGIYLYLATDQVRFYEYDPVAYAADRWTAGRGDLLTVEAVPPLAFSEIMRDVDLFVGVSSVGNDPEWQDGGPEGRHATYWHDYSFGNLTANAETRREILERLVPRLKIADRCSLSDRFLIVRGDLRTYKIHLGSSNILMTPNDQYLCIVQGPRDTTEKVFLPFEGDQRLAIILSKAMMLAEDNKIKDTTILSQINRPQAGGTQ